jgi:hypothetical protein
MFSGSPIPTAGDVTGTGSGSALIFLPNDIASALTSAPTALQPGVSPHPRAESVLTYGRMAFDLPAETASRSTITQICEGTSQIQRMVLAGQFLKG